MPMIGHAFLPEGTGHNSAPECSRPRMAATSPRIPTYDLLVISCDRTHCRCATRELKKNVLKVLELSNYEDQVVFKLWTFFFFELPSGINKLSVSKGDHQEIAFSPFESVVVWRHAARSSAECDNGGRVLVRFLAQCEWGTMTPACRMSREYSFSLLSFFVLGFHLFQLPF